MFFRAMQYVASLKDEKKEDEKKEHKKNTGWIIDGKWCGPKRGSGGSKGDRKAQEKRRQLKRQLARKLARDAGTARRPGRPSGSTIKQQYQTYTWMRRRLRGKQRPVGVTDADAHEGGGEARVGKKHMAAEAQEAQTRMRAAEKQAAEEKAIAEAIAERPEDMAAEAIAGCV